LDDLIKMIARQLDVVPKVFKEAGRRFDVPSIVLDCNKARETYGWEPAIPFREGLAELADWQKCYFNGDFKHTSAASR
jgi:nucleoside-diphosphate-sugar epimerase